MPQEAREVPDGVKEFNDVVDASSNFLKTVSMPVYKLGIKVSSVLRKKKERAIKKKKPKID